MQRRRVSVVVAAAAVAGAGLAAQWWWEHAAAARRRLQELEAIAANLGKNQDALLHARELLLDSGSGPEQLVAVNRTLGQIANLLQPQRLDAAREAAGDGNGAYIRWLEDYLQVSGSIHDLVMRGIELDLADLARTMLRRHPRGPGQALE